MQSLKELCIEHELQVNQILKMIVESQEGKLFLQINTKVDGLSRNGFLPLEKQFQIKLEMSCRQDKDLNVRTEVIFSSDSYVDDEITYFKTSILHPHNYCNIYCDDEKISITDFLLFRMGGNPNANAEDKEKSGANKLKAKTIDITSSLLYIKDFNQILGSVKDSSGIASVQSKLCLGLSLNDILTCLDPNNPHFNPGIPLSIDQWVKNNNDQTFEDSSEKREESLNKRIEQFISAGELDSPLKAGVLNGVVALSASGSVKRGRKKEK